MPFICYMRIYFDNYFIILSSGRLVMCVLRIDMDGGIRLHLLTIRSLNANNIQCIFVQHSEIIAPKNKNIEHTESTRRVREKERDTYNESKRNRM